MGIDTTAKKVQINKLVRSQLPSFVAEDNPQFVDFLKQYYISQEYQGGSIDIATNFNEYQKVDTFNEHSELVGFTTCTNDINSYDSTIVVSSTEGWPADYGLLKIDDEIITYTSKTDTSFVGCVRGFCGVDNLHEPTSTENLVFSESNAVKHEGLSKVTNLSNLFLQEFWKKTKNQFLPGFEDRELHNKVDKANFLRQAKDFYASKGTDEAIKILFGVLFNDQAEVIKPIDYLFAPSDADYVKTFDLVAEVISGNPDNIVGQTLFQTDNTATSGSIFNVQFLPKDDKNYYLISLSRGSIVGAFEATGASKLVDNVVYNSNTGVGATVLTVDSTLGFPDKGTVYVGAGLTVGIATYSSKTSTQFYGVTGISSSYTDGDFVRSSRTIFAYEDGNVEKPVFFRLTNVVTGANIDDIAHTHTEDIVYPRQLGLVSDPNIQQLNSWIHNVKIKTDVATRVEGTTTLSIVDDNLQDGVVDTSTPHELQIGDEVIIYDILRSAVGTPDNVTGKVDSIPNPTKFTITNKTGTLDETKTYQVGRKLKYASSLNDRLNVSNFVANVQNTYISDDNKTAYVTSGSLPGYEISADHRSKTFNGFNAVSNDIINIPNHNFKTGELVRYNPSEGDVAVSGLSTGFAYAVIKQDTNNIKLSRSVLDAAAKKHININSTASSTTHTIVPEELSDKNLKHQNFIREFPITPEVKVDTRDIKNEPIGMFVNGVEIFSNQSGDNVFYGPIEHIDVERGGDDYDVIQPPNIHISDNVGTGATAYAVIEGSFKSIEVISGGYDIKNVPNISITGGNGHGATAYPRLKAIRNARTFDANVNVTLNTQATATVSLSGGVIQNSVTIVNAGSGYITAPTVTVNTTNPHTGADAQLTAAINASGQVSGITVVSGGSGYASGEVTLTLSGPASRITFADDHLFFDGEEVIYEKSKDNAQLPGLIDKSVYYVHNVSGNSKQIALMNTFENAISGTNAVTITSKSIGTHKIESTTFRNVIDKIVVENSGFGYSNRKVSINSDAHPAVDYANRSDIRSGISIANDYIFHKNHGFRNGDLVEYSHTGTAISGISTTIKYLIIKLDEDKFRLCSAGDDYINNLYSEEFGTTATTVNYSKGLYVDINSIGAGTHTFKYPDISVSMDVISGVGNTAVSFPVIRPVCRGGITDIHLTNTGVGYGSSDTINAHRRPLVTISNGIGALVDVSITDGVISDAFTKIDGKGYVSPPDLIVEGQGKFGKLVSNVNEDGTLGVINIIDSGKDYTTIPDTTVRVKSPGVGAVFRADLKKWNMTTIARYQESINPSDDGIILPSQNPEYESKFVSAYLPRELRLALNDSIEDLTFDEKSVVEHSPIVGWAYDGCPIYGPYGFNSPNGGAVRRLTSGYTAVTRDNRPSLTAFPVESFIEDFDYTGNGDLDENNGRFGKTPEYPDGVYAYFCTISDTDGSVAPFNSVRKPVFPFILNGYQFNRVDVNVQALSLQSTSKLNSGNIIRNTLPYRLGFIGSNYDYLVSDNIDDTEFTIRNTNMTGITSISVHEPGVDYKVGDRLKFDNSNTGGGHGVSAKVRTIAGKGIVDISYAKTTVEHIEFNYKNGLGIGIGSTAHGLHDGDLVNVSGIGTGELRFLEGHKTIGVASVTSKLSVGISSITGHADSTGRTALLYLTQQTTSRDNDDTIKVGDWLIIGDDDDSVKEKVQVIEYSTFFDRYKVRRQTGIGNTWFDAGTSVVVDQKRFTFSVGIATDLRIGDNYTITINPQSSIGIGTILKTEAGPYGNVSVARVVAKDNTVLYDRDPQNRPHNTQPGSNCDNLITFENHGFVTGQKLQYFKSPEAAAGLKVSQNVGMGASFSLTDGQFVYAVKKTDDLFGIQTTRVGIGSTSKSLYFATIGATGGNVNVFDDHQLKTTNEKHIGFVDKFDVTVVTSLPHELKDKDRVTISISPDQTINKSIEYDTVARKTIVDPSYFGTDDINLTDNTIKIINHGFNDGDKILYKAGTTAITPLEDRDEYYVKKISNDHFRLFTNRKDSISDPNAFINLTNVGSSAGAGGHHRISRINPPIKALLGETVGFAVSDPSNTNFTLEFFRDKNFTNRFDGVGISTEVTRSGVSGSTGGLVNLKLTNNIPLPLWYKLTPSIKNNAGDYIDVTKRDSHPDTQVINGSRISLELSQYSGNFGIKTTGVGNTAFTYQVAEKPEKERYNSAGVSTFRYVTESKNAKGGINEIKIDFPGREYIRNPGITSIRSTAGKDADVRILDDNVGFPAFTEVTKIGYDYPTDKTLSPRADTYANVSVVNNYVIGHIGIVTAGKNYSTAPDLFFPDRPFAKTKVYLEGTSIGSVEILEDSLTGFSNVPNPPRIIAINNTNGVGVVTAKCFDNSGNPNEFPLIEIKKPFGGWRPENHRLGTNFPFEVGDQVFIENVEVTQNDNPIFYDEGKVIGYNSDMYDYQYFTITERNIANSWFKYSLVGIGTWGGTFDPVNSAGRVIKREDLPSFNVRFDHRDFIEGESVTFGGGSAEGVIVMNEGWDRATNSFRLRGLTRNPFKGDVIVGSISNAQGKVIKSSYYERYFTLSHKSDRVKGFQKNTGKLNNDFQKIQDSDYYQNFSYSIQSEVQEKDFSDAVDSILHPTGYKNFSDLVIKSLPTAGSGRSVDLSPSPPQSDTGLNVIIDNVQSFYVKNDYDFATETTIEKGLSKFITFQNKKLTDLLSISSAKVNLLDDISNQFDGKSDTFLGEHKFLRSDSSINGGAGITIVSGGSGSLTPAVKKYHSVSNAVYTASNGNLVLTLESGHGLLVNESIHIEKESLPFTCAMDGNSYIKNYPRSTDPQYNKFVDITAVSGNNITVNVGTSPIVNHNVTNATYNPNTGDMELTIGSHTLDIGESVKITTGSLIFQCTQDNNGSDHAYPRNTIDNHTAVDADYDPATGLIDIKTSAAHGMTVGDLVKLDDNSISFKCDYGNYPHTYVGGTVTNGVSVTGGSSFNVTDAYYTGHDGHLVLTIGTHSLTTSNTVTLTSGAFKFTCDSDDNTAIISYPRATDPAHNTAINIIAVDQAGGRITVNVGTKADDVKSYPRATDPISGKWKKVISTPSNDRFVIQVLNTIPSTNIDTHYFVSATNNGIKQKRDRAYDSAIPIKAVTSTKITLNVGKSSNTTTHRWKPNHTASNAIQSGGNYTHTWAGGTKTDSVTSGGTSYDPSTGKLTIVTTTAHGLANGSTISIADNSLIFACDRDNYATEHAYPRPSDPASTSNAKLNNGVLAISNKSGSSFELTINTPVIGGKVVGLSTFVLTTENGGNNVFHNIIDPSNTDTIAIGKSVFTAINHGLQTGEAITYVPGSNTSIGINPTAFRVATTDITIGTEQIEIIGHGLSTADTLTYTAGSTAIGGLTNSTTYYVIRVNNNTIKLATNTSNANSGTAINLTSVGAGTHVFTTAANPTMPTNAYAFKTSDNTFKVIRDPLTPVDYAYTLRNVGTGTYHAFNPTSPESRTLIEIDGVIQSPLYKKAISVAFASNVSNSATSVTLVGITSMRTNDIISVGDELMRIKAIGVGGANVCTVERGFLGTSAAAHTTSSSCVIKDGDFNIVNGVLHLTTPPYGPAGSTGISTSSTFHGRVFNRKDVTRNFIFDDISHKFTGENNITGKEFTLTQNDENVTGIVTTVSGTGGAGQVTNNGIVLINNIFQRPDIDYTMDPRSLFRVATTDITIGTEQIEIINHGLNTPDALTYTAGSTAIGGLSSGTKYYVIKVDDNTIKLATNTSNANGGTAINLTSVGAGTHVFTTDSTVVNGGSITFSGTTTNYTIPRGGKVEDFAVNFGKGYQPRRAAAATAVVNDAGSIQSLTMTGAGRGYFSGSVNVEVFNPLGVGSAAVLQATVGTGNSAGMITGITTISGGTGYSSADPAYNTYLPVVSVGGTTLTINVGTALPKGRYQHTFISALSNSVVTGTGFVVTGSGSTTQFTPNGATYDPNSGDLVITKASGTWTHTTNAGTLTPISGTIYDPIAGIATVKATGHGLGTGDKINILEGALPFTCAKDNHATEHYYPRKTDPVFGKWIKVTRIDNDTFKVWVGGSTYTGIHTFVTGKSANKIRKATSYARLNDNSFTFTCSKDGNATQHSYPRTGTTVPPIIKVGIATGYSDLVFTGGSGQGFRANVVVGSGGTVIDYDVTDRGYGYKNGEVLTAQGIPFEPGISTSSLTFTINKTITDKFAGFSFGQLVALDNFADQFDNDTKSFLLTKLNVNTGVKDIVTIVSLDTSIDADNNLLIFLNDVLQKPGENYSLEGGTTLNFVEAPKEGSKLQVLFYRGGNADIEALNPVKTFKIGDKVQLLQGGDRPRQSDRVVSDISDVSKIETPLYGGGGISTDSSLVRVASWKKQESDLVVDGLPISKERSNYTGKFRPVSNIIQNVATSNITIYLDSGWPLFSAYDNRTNNDSIPGEVELMNVNDVTTARGTVGISSGGVVNSITVTDFGSGYGSAPTVSISSKVTQTPEIGASWTKSTPLTDINYKDIDYIPEGVFVAVGSTSGIHTSTDGKTWTSSASVTASTWNGVVGMSTAAVAVGAAGTIGISTNAASSFTATRIYRKTQTGFLPSYTDENISQSLRAAAIGVVPISRIVGNQLVTEDKERAVVVGAAGTILYSEPGQSGIATSFVVANKYANQQFNGIAYRSPYVKESGDAVGPAFIAVGNNGAIYKSTNGEVWSGITTTTITTNINAIEYADDQWIAVGAGGKVFRSTKEQDGSAWQVVGSGTTFALWSLSYQDNVWYAGGGNGMGLNSVNGFEWYKKHMISSDETPVGVVINGLAYGDNKLVAVGVSSNIHYSQFEVSKATATTTVSAAGTVTGATITNAGFGYDSTNPPNILFSTQTVTRERITNCEIKGDYGTVVSVAKQTSGVNSRPTLILGLDASPFINQVAFGNKSLSQLVVGDYFVLKGTRFGPAGGLTATDGSGNTIGVGDAYADGIYKVEAVSSSGGVLTVSTNVSSVANVTAVSGGNVGIARSMSSNLGEYSWSKLYNFTRSTTPSSFTVNTNNGYSGISTGPTVSRVSPIALEYSDLSSNS